jgi:AcrR family transcriptional regulator
MPTPRQPQPPARPASKGERTRAAILDAGYRLFLRQGYAATSMRQIADEVGLAPGAAYKYFHGKEGIFVAILEERHPFLQVLPAMQAARGETVEELARDAAARMIDILSAREEVFNLMFIELIEFKAKHVPRMFKVFFPQLMSFAQRFTQARGALRPLPLPTVLRAFVGLFFSYFMTEKLIGSQLPPEMKAGAFDQFVDIYLHGILAQTPA